MKLSERMRRKAKAICELSYTEPFLVAQMLDAFADEAAQLETELAGMILMEAEGESFGETIVRENEQLKEEITTWEAKAALFVDQGEELQQEKFRHCVTKKLLANEQAMLNKRYEQMEQLKTERDALVDTLEHCGYDPEDCIDCGGPPHNKWCRFWKLRHILSYWEEEIERAQ